MRQKQRPIPNTKEIVSYFHCALCLGEKPTGISPKVYQRLEAGFTELGIQVWCARHEVNILHVDFENVRHPANTTRREGTDAPDP